MITPTSSNVIPARSATSSAQVSASSHSSLSGKFIFTDPVRGFTSTYRLYLHETYGQGRAPSAQSPRVLGRLASSSAISVCNSGSRPPAAACWRKSRAISLRLIVRARWRGLSSGSSTTGRTFLFGSLMKASSLPGLFPCGDFGDSALHILDELVRVLAALGEETVQLLAPRRAQLALGEARLRELHAPRREEVDDLGGGDPLRVLLLEHVEVVAFPLRHQHLAQGAAPSYAPAPTAML